MIPSTIVGIREPDRAAPLAHLLYRELSTNTTATVQALAEREKRTLRTTTEESR